jgi:hypothetical protein
MLSEHFPPWVIMALSPLFQLIGKKVPAVWKPWSFFGLAVGATAGVIAWTPEIAWVDFLPQALALLATTGVGYTMAKPVDGLEIRGRTVAGILVACGGLWALGAAGAAWAQPDSMAAAPEAAGELQSSLGVLGLALRQITYGLINGLLGRLFKRLPF